jgi:hypothetical protein
VKIQATPCKNSDGCNTNQGTRRYSSKIKDYPQDSVSFHGAIDACKDLTTGAFTKLASQGFFIEFLIVDTISMILPRALVGANRDREKTGEYNIKAAAEEFGREITSGPSMNLIPMAICLGFSSVWSATHMNKNTLRSLTNNAIKTIAGRPEIVKDKTEINKALAGKLFDDTFGEHSFKDGQATEYKNRFIDLLVGSTEAKKKFPGFLNREHNAKVEARVKEFETLIAKIHNTGTLMGKKGLKNGHIVSGEIYPLDTSEIKLSTGQMQSGEKNVPVKASVNARELYTDFHNYSKDILTRLINKVGSTINKQTPAEILNELKRNRIILKLAAATAAFFAVGNFLLVLPKLYQQGKVSPAKESAKRAQAEVKGGNNDN